MENPNQNLTPPDGQTVIEASATQELLERAPGLIALLGKVIKEGSLTDVDVKRLKSAMNSLNRVSNGLQRAAIASL